MFSRKFFLVCGAALISSTAFAVETPNLGQPISQDDLKAWDISIAPDGGMLPPGKGTAAEGKPIFQEKCAACHGEGGKGGEASALFGGEGTLKYPAVAVRTVGSYWPYATTVYDIINRAMPATNPKTLTPDETYALTAYVLSLSGIVSENQEMNRKTLPQVKMPNRDNFKELYPEKK